MALTDSKIKNLSPESKIYKKFDAHGLYLEVSPAGSKLWRFRYKFQGKSKLLSLGRYPEVGLKKARELRDKANLEIIQGIDPAFERKKSKREQVKEKTISENTFHNVSKEWWESNSEAWADDYSRTIWRRLENNLFPWIGSLPITEIDPPTLLQQLRRIEDRGANETAKRISRYCNHIFQYSIITGKSTRNPAAEIQGVLKKAPVRHMPALTEPRDIKSLLRAIDAYEYSFIVSSALKVSALTFVRPGELRKATWDEVDLEEALWKIPAYRMKMRKDHIVPLARQTVDVLQDLRPLTLNCRGNFVFPGERMNGRPMSENTVNMALRSMGFSKDQMCAHGFRTMASTRLHESGLWDSRVIEIQLAHVDKNTIRGIYNRALYLDQRKKLMQWWADYLDSLREGAKVIPLQRQAASE